MRSAAPFDVLPFVAVLLVLGCAVPGAADAQAATSHDDRDAHAAETAHPAAAPPAINWWPGATLPPRTPERNLFAAPPPERHDTVIDGAFYGAMAGAGAMVAPSLLGRTRTPLVIGAVAGAAIGSVIDARHVTPGFRPAVVVLAAGDAKSAGFLWRF